EQEAQEQNKEYVMGRYDYKDTGMGAALEEKNGFVKLIVERKTKEILGCHIIGPEASTLIHEVVVAMKADRRKALDILRTAVHVHPALSEVVQRAALSVPV
ncbi:MAG: dihydrolipoamide dehydrogenase, partial [Nanoarchaeota archaeon]